MSNKSRVLVYPFVRDFLETEGVTVLEEFRDWVYDEGDEFFHNQRVARQGDVIVFAWVEKGGEWYLVGDAIVKINEESEEAKKYGLTRRIITKGVRTYPRSVSSKELDIKLEAFIELTPEQYLTLLQKTVTQRG